MTILVTGGSGFIGSNLVDELINKNFDVCIIDKEEPIFRNKSARYYIMDLASEAVSSVFEKEKITKVVHLAAQTSVNISVENPKNDGIDNILATLNLLDNCKKFGVKKIIASSSAAVYGEPEYLPVNETHRLSPLSPYALSKYTMEGYAAAYSEKGVTGAGVLTEEDENYYTVATAEEFLNALQNVKKSGANSVIFCPL